jgi:murein L,D-transpeptidase YcbB/YkuD
MYWKRVRPIFIALWMLFCSSVSLAQEPYQNIEEVFNSPALQQFSQVRDAGLSIRELAEFYEARGFEPAWIRQNALGNAARELLDTLDRADTHGLRVEDYRWRILSPENLPADLAAVDAATRARLDIALSGAAMRYIKDLHEGRFNPIQLGLNLDTGYHHIELNEKLSSLLSAESTANELGRYAPQIPVIDGTTTYNRMREALASYRAMAAESTWQSLPGDTVIHPGERYVALDLLQRRLELAGDMAPGIPVPDVYEGRIVEGVMQFQRRHGLDVDGVLGAKSFAALNVPWSDRAAQIAIALERMRWVPNHELGRVILVNVPQYHLYAFQRDGEAIDLQFESDVIVGKTYARYQTPIFSGTLAYLDFRPYWNIPWSIVRREMRQHFDQPDYLQSKELEMVSGFGLNAEPLTVND